jgi:hypothetical protein
MVVHEADEPNALVDFLDAESLAGQHGRDVDPLAMQAEPSAFSDRLKAEALNGVPLTPSSLFVLITRNAGLDVNPSERSPESATDAVALLEAG